MTTIPTGLAIKSATSSERTTPQGIRLALAGLVTQSAPGIPVSGRLRAPSDANGEPLSIATSGSALTYKVNAGVAAIYRTGQGLYLVANPSVVTLTTTAPIVAGQTLIDIIYIFQPDYELGDATGSGNLARVDFAHGTAGTPGLAPTIPTGAMELGRKTIAYGATNTNAGSPITNIPAMTDANASVADGAITTAKLADGAVTDAKVTAVSGAKITSGIIPAGVDYLGKLQGHPYIVQQADPGIGSVANGTLWDSW